MKKLFFVFISLLALSCHKFPESPLESDDDLKHTPGIVRIEPDNDCNLVLYLDYSYSVNATILVERKAKGGFESVGYLQLSQTALVDTSFNKEFDNAFIYRVCVEKGDLRSDYSAEKSYEYISSILNMPQNLRIDVLELQGNEISWSDRSGREEGYKVEKNDGSGWQDLATLPANTEKYMHSISGIPSLPMALSYRVKAFNSALSSQWADISTSYTGIGVPTNLHISDTTAYRFTIEWTDNSNIESGYVIERNKNGGTFNEIAEINANVTKYIDRITDAGSYSYRVKAKKDSFYSLCSIEVSYSFKVILPTEGLVAYYPFSANANDKSGYGNHGIVSGAVLANDRFGNGSCAYSFDGNDDYIDCGDPLDGLFDFGQSQDFALCFWIKTSMTPRWYPMIIVKEALGTSNSTRYGYYSILSNDGTIVFATWKSGKAYSAGGGKLNDGNWHFVCGIRNGSSIETYIDGILKESNPAVSVDIANDAPLTFGKHPTNSSFDYYNGILDDVRLYKIALKIDEIQALYHEGGWWN